MSDKQIEIRESYESDRNFIYSTWLRGIYFGNDWFHEIPSDIYYKNYQLVLDEILKRPKLTISIACLADDKDVILGYIVYEQTVIHYIFVKESWRKMGIAKKLSPTNITVCTHLTNIGKSLKKKYDIVFNPFI